MEHPEQYYNRDMWPPENDRPLMFRLASDVPVLQNTLIRIFVIGLSKVIFKCLYSVKTPYIMVGCMHRRTVFTFGLKIPLLHVVVFSYQFYFL